MKLLPTTCLLQVSSVLNTFGFFSKQQSRIRRSVQKPEIQMISTCWGFPGLHSIYRSVVKTSLMSVQGIPGRRAPKFPFGRPQPSGKLRNGKKKVPITKLTPSKHPILKILKSFETLGFSPKSHRMANFWMFFCWMATKSPQEAVSGAKNPKFFNF